MNNKTFFTLQPSSATSGSWRPRANDFTVYVHAESVTVGGTVKVQARALPLSVAGANWADIPTASLSVTTNGDFVIKVSGAFSIVRVSLTLTDGLYSIYGEAA